VQPARIETTFVDDAHAREGLAALPEGSTWRHLIGTAFLAGIGFTTVLFISGLACVPARVSSARPNWRF